MRLKVSEQLNVNASRNEVWKLLRDTVRLAALLPGVQEVSPLNEPGGEAYSAKVTDQIGPFKLVLRVEIRITEAREASHLAASIKGADPIGLNRITGALRIMLAPGSAGTEMQFEAEIEILGKLATLGAVPIRRRATQKFAEFARNIHGQFAAISGADANRRLETTSRVRAVSQARSAKGRR